MKWDSVSQTALSARHVISKLARRSSSRCAMKSGLQIRLDRRIALALSMTAAVLGCANEGSVVVPESESTPVLEGRARDRNKGIPREGVLVVTVEAPASGKLTFTDSSGYYEISYEDSIPSSRIHFDLPEYGAQDRIIPRDAENLRGGIFRLDVYLVPE
jgi:hypothetical protein